MRQRVVSLGGWNESFVFPSEEDAMNAFDLLQKATRISTEYLGNKRVAVMGKDLELRLELLDVMSEAEYQTLVASQREEAQPQATQEEIPLAA